MLLQQVRARWLREAETPLAFPNRRFAEVIWRGINSGFSDRRKDLSVPHDEKAGYNRFLLLVAGLGGLLYGVDVGIIAGALPYLEATSGLNAGQLSIMVAAVLLGSVVSMLIAGLLADLMGRKTL